MKFTSPYQVSFPNQDILTYVFGGSVFKEDDPVWFNSADTSEYVTLRQARSLTGRIGRKLQHLGVGTNGPGRDIVLSYVQNQTMTSPTCFGVICSGGIHSACPISATAPELARQISICKPKVLICSELTRRNSEIALQLAGLSNTVHLLIMDSRLQDVKNAAGGLSLPLEEASWKPITDPLLLETTTAVLLFSSGTTGTPKGSYRVKLTHRNIVSNLVQMRYFFDRIATRQQAVTKRLRMLGIIQNSAPAGILVHSMMALQTGMQVYLVAKYNFNDLARMIRDYEISVLFLVPAIYQRILQTFERKDLQHVRFAMSGASPLSPDLQRRVSDLLPEGIHLNVNWGMTETTCGGTQLEPNEADGEGSVGRLLPGSELIILRENGSLQSFEQLGEICIKGPNIMQSYFENPGATKSAFTEDGWFRTGDIGMMSKSGKLFIKGRSKELLKYKGHQISPSELEGILGECPGIEDAGVIGVQDELGNDVPRAYLVRNKSNVCTVDGVHQFFNARVSSYKRLRGGVVFIKAIPRNTNGKIMREVLKFQASSKGAKTSQQKL